MRGENAPLWYLCLISLPRFIREAGVGREGGRGRGGGQGTELVLTTMLHDW